MKKVTYLFEVRTNSNGTVSIKNGILPTPRIHFSGKTTKWYEDKYKEAR